MQVFTMVRHFLLALLKHWIALMGCAIFTGIAFFAAWMNKTNQWLVATIAVTALFCFLWATFLAWREEHVRRLAAESSSNWKSLADGFEGLNDGGAVSARWTREIKSGALSWEVMGGSVMLKGLSEEMCKKSGKQLLHSNKFCSLFPNLAAMRRDQDRWLSAIWEIVDSKVQRGTSSSESIVYGRTDYEWGQISNLCGLSRVLCYKAMNDFSELIF